jgi:mRNA interferase MazF
MTSYDGLATQVAVGVDDGLKHDSSIHCDELVSLPKSMLTDYVGALRRQKVQELALALRIALAVES